jgi:hypothetical protein
MMTPTTGIFGPDLPRIGFLGDLRAAMAISLYVRRRQSGRMRTAEKPIISGSGFIANRRNPGVYMKW